MNEVLNVSKANRTRGVTTDLEWKRTYLRELEKKKQRQKVAVAATEAELPRIQAEIAELEEELDGHQRAQISPS